jgi:RNA polymerase sigma factor (sigma-70 family)
VQALVQQFEDRVWDAALGTAPGGEADLLARCREIGVSLEDILAEQSEETLALAVQRNFFRRAAFEELLVVRYQEKLFGWFCRRGMGPDRAGDLIQEMYLKLYRSSLGRYDPAQSFDAYLFTASRNLWIQKVVRPRKQQGSDWLVDVPGLDSPLEAIAAAELQARIDRALLNLREDYREVLALSMEGLQSQEIAGRLGLALHAVYRKLFQARKRLAEVLGIVRPRSNRGRKPNKPDADPPNPTPGESRAEN